MCFSWVYTFFKLQFEILFNGTWDIFCGFVHGCSCSWYRCTGWDLGYESTSLKRSQTWDRNTSSQMIRQIVNKPFSPKFSQLICKGKTKANSLQTDFLVQVWPTVPVVCTRFSCNGFSNALTFSSAPKQRCLDNVAQLLACLRPVWFSKQSCFLPFICSDVTYSQIVSVDVEVQSLNHNQ